jgi:hypothetical protein
MHPFVNNHCEIRMYEFFLGCWQYWVRIFIVFISFSTWKWGQDSEINHRCLLSNMVGIDNLNKLGNICITKQFWHVCSVTTSRNSVFGVSCVSFCCTTSVQNICVSNKYLANYLWVILKVHKHACKNSCKLSMILSSCNQSVWMCSLILLNTKYVAPTLLCLQSTTLPIFT